MEKEKMATRVNLSGRVYKNTFIRLAWRRKNVFNAGNDEIALNNFIRNTNLRCAPGHIDLDPRSIRWHLELLQVFLNLG